MNPELLRSAAFVAGFVTLLSWEVVAPEHAPTVSRRQRFATNLTLALINGVAIALLWSASAGVVLRADAPWQLHVFPRLAAWPVLRVVAEVLTLDLLQYWLHRLYHELPFFWRFHRVHHTDLDLDVSSASRFHLGEVATSAAAKLIVVASLGVSPAGLLAFEVTLLLCAQFQHANVLVGARLERALWWVTVPPAMHRVHHRPTPQDTNSNYGTIVSVWDRLFGTLRVRALVGDVFGLAEYRDLARLSLWRLLQLPAAKGRGESASSPRAPQP